MTSKLESLRSSIQNGDTVYLLKPEFDQNQFMSIKNEIIRLRQEKRNHEETIDETHNKIVYTDNKMKQFIQNTHVNNYDEDEDFVLIEDYQTKYRLIDNENLIIEYLDKIVEYQEELKNLEMDLDNLKKREGDLLCKLGEITLNSKIIKFSDQFFKT